MMCCVGKFVTQNRSYAPCIIEIHSCILSKLLKEIKMKNHNLSKTLHYSSCYRPFLCEGNANMNIVASKIARCPR